MADPYTMLTQSIQNLDMTYKNKLAHEAAMRSQQGINQVDLMRGLVAKVHKLKNELDANKLKEDESSKHKGYFPGGEFEFGKTKDVEQWLEKFKDFADIKNFDVDETIRHLKL